MIFAYVTSLYWCILGICLLSRVVDNRSNASSEPTEQQDVKLTEDHDDKSNGIITDNPGDRQDSSTVCHSGPSSIDNHLNIDTNTDNGGGVPVEKLIPAGSVVSDKWVPRSSTHKYMDT